MLGGGGASRAVHQRGSSGEQVGAMHEVLLRTGDSGGDAVEIGRGGDEHEIGRVEVWRARVGDATAPPCPAQHVLDDDGHARLDRNACRVQVANGALGEQARVDGAHRPGEHGQARDVGNRGEDGGATEPGAVFGVE